MHVDHFFQKVNSKRIKKFKETGDTKYIYRNELDKAYFQHDMAYVDFKNLGKRTASDKVLSDKAFNAAKNSKYDGYQRSTASMVYIFLDKKISRYWSTALANKSAIKNQTTQNWCPLDLATQQLSEELHKLIIRKLKKE